ncbi:MAG TPA: AbrB/MazE/SpoVT family DNA-binding domain-containing protein [Candidatus Altiarchaeales archaeon]|nr:AbrB/MazE/SpoVT family DNA-binding domain-containing protein [Candidatus Altiarchaeales archaeon]
MRYASRFHKLRCGGGQLTIPKDLVKALNLGNREKVMLEYDEDNEGLRITRL